jgi:uncharacterized protein (DUF433 family)
MMKQALLKRIEINADIMLAKPVIRGTRLPAALIVEKIVYGATFDEILKQYPFLESNDIQAALLYAASVMMSEEVITF